MGQVLVMPAEGSCVETSNAAATATVPIAITKPVGQGSLARNVPSDVKIIQQALNQVTVVGKAGGPIPFLVVDGLVGPKTIAAILNFQKVQVPVIAPDGVIEPGKRTILRLNEIVAPVSKFDLNAKLAASLPLVKAALAAAAQNVGAIISGGPNASDEVDSATDRLDRHFKLNTLDALGQSRLRVTLFETYSEMALVVNQPELFGMLGAVDAFDVDPSDALIASTNRQGAFLPPLKDGADNPARHIRLGLGFFAANVSPEFAAFILIHELSHFVGRSDGQQIIDHGRGWFDDVFIRPLKASQRLLNADSYATFAHECRTGSPVKPAFVKTSPGGRRGGR
ncbi:MAG TPA: hypothetical protein VHV77_17075 [Pirellulales bacterium]|jgi:peptidoglycan hydrolase-like protein with peptidoglycan-binding domain|nr:hypothetical protein [Pirellulales bacterium]